VTDGQTVRRSDRFTIASTALTAMLTRCKNDEG